MRHLNGKHQDGVFLGLDLTPFQCPCAEAPGHILSHWESSGTTGQQEASPMGMRWLLTQLGVTGEFQLLHPWLLNRMSQGVIRSLKWLSVWSMRFAAPVHEGNMKQ